MKGSVRLLLIMIVIVLFALYVLSQAGNLANNTNSTALLEMSESAAAEGRQVYKLSQNHNSPQFTEAIINPENVRVGETQTMTVLVTDNYPIIEVKATIATDNNLLVHDLGLVSGNSYNGTWEGSWVVEDTHDITYHTVFTALNEIGESTEVRLSWTDPGLPCGTGGPCAISSGSYTVTGVDGADGGNLALGGSLTLTVAAGATLVFNQGYNITLSAASIALNSTAKIATGYICMIDQDSDGYPATTTQYHDAVSGSCSSFLNGRRRSSMISATSLDCCEAVALVNPGAVGQSVLISGCGNSKDGTWDYNCNGSTQIVKYPCAGYTQDYCQCATGVNPSGYGAYCNNVWSGCSVVQVHRTITGWAACGGSGKNIIDQMQLGGAGCWTSTVACNAGGTPTYSQAYWSNMVDCNQPCK